jgi:peptide deformylase
MAIRKVARMGHPILRKKARELTVPEIRSAEIQRLIDDMVETMHEYGGVGLAAPQVHESLQISVIEFSDDSSRYPEMGNQALSVFINPKMKVLDSEEQGYWEGCLSIPEIRGLVFRPRKIEVEFFDREGTKKKIVAEGFLATVFQHEFDHLNGTLFIDRIQDTTRLAFLEEYRKYWLSSEEQELPD